MPSRFYIHYFTKFGRPSNGHRIGKGQSSSQFPRRVVSKNALTIRQLHSSPMLIKVMLKILHARLQHYVNQNLQMPKLDLEKEKELEIKLPIFIGL